MVLNRRRSGLAFQFDIPIEVIAPGLGRRPESDRDVEHARDPFGFFRTPYQFHSGFLRSASALSMIAFETAGNDVFPGFSTAIYNGFDMVKCEILRGMLFPAILAGVVIACINIGPAEFDTLGALSDLYILQEAENAGQLDGKADASDLAIVFGQNFNLALV